MKTLLSVVLLISALYTSAAAAFGAANIGFSEYRLLLTKQQKHQQLTLFNKGNQEAKCEIGLTHFKVTNDNALGKPVPATQAYKPANKLFRFSPRRVMISPNGSQKVKLSFRRKANLVDGEYNSYLNMTCVTDEKSSGGQMGAVISYNIPAHLRIGELAVESKFSVLKLTNTADGGYDVVIRQSRQGNRSLIGTFEVVDRKSDDVLVRKTGFALYQPAQYVDHAFHLLNKPSDGLEISFTESQNYGGNVAQKLIVSGHEF